MKLFSKIAFSALIVGSLAFASCKGDDPVVVDNSIYARLGGATLKADPKNSGQQIEAGRLAFRDVVDTTINLIIADIVGNKTGNLGKHFAPILGETGTTQSSNLAKLSDNLVDFFAFNTGGEKSAVNKYNGLGMVQAHTPGTGSGQNPRMGAKSTSADYDKFVGYVGAAAQGKPYNLKESDQLYKDIVAVLVSLKSQIVIP